MREVRRPPISPVVDCPFFTLFLPAQPGFVFFALLPVTAQAVKQLPVAAVACGGLVDYHDVEVFEHLLVMSKRLADNALDPVSCCCCPAMLFRYCQAKAACRVVIVVAKNRKPFVAAARRIFEYPPIGRSINQPLIFAKTVLRAANQRWIFRRRENRLRRQCGTALGTAARKHEAAAFCRHAGTETMGACAC